MLSRRVLYQQVRHLRASSAARATAADPQGQPYRTAFKRALDEPQEFWGEIAEDIVWTKKWERVLDDSKSPFTKWFPGGELSVCYNAVDRHVDEGRGGNKALIWDSAITGNKKTWTYQELLKEVSTLSRVLADQGLKRGDRALIYMPMIPETVAAMLAVGRLGAVHSVVFGGFAARELATRIRHCQPKVILAASCGVEPTRTLEYKPILDEALRLSGAPSNTPVVIYQRPGLTAANLDGGKNELCWKSEAEKVNGRGHDCVPIEANDPLYILYTSGTTGEPKGVQHPAGGHAVVNKWTMDALYGMKPDDVWWAASDLGWIVGHEYICYSPLLNGNPSVVYEGKPVGTPDAGQFFRVLSEHDVRGMFVAPTALRAIHRADPALICGKQYDISRLKYLFVAGEACDDETRFWALKHFKTPVIDNWWQTETAHAITCNCIGLGNETDQPHEVGGFPVPGFDVRVLRPDGSQADEDELGRIAIKLPMPPGTLSTLYEADERFQKTYFSQYPGFYDTMDAGIKHEEGYIQICGRDDDVINVAGHRLSTSALEEAVLTHPAVVDCAVIGIPDKLKGQIPLAFFIVDTERKGTDPETVSKELVQVVRNEIGAVAAFRLSTAVSGLPRTRSGKTARKSLADMAAGKKVKIPPTIEDVSIYKEMKSAIEALNLGVKIQEL